MTDKDLILELQTLKSVHPDKRWVVLTRERFAGDGVRVGAWQVWGVFVSRMLNAAVSYPAAVSVAVVALVLTGGISAQFTGRMHEELGKNLSFAVPSHREHVSYETTKELAEIKQLAIRSVKTDNETRANNAVAQNSEHTVVLNENSDREAQFKKVLRERIESKIIQVKDLFAQLENGDSAREISLNHRRYEENFKLADEKVAMQVRDLLKEAESALGDGNLIDALDVVNTIEKLLH